MGLTQYLDHGVILGWPTPILTREIDNDDLAPRLARIILEKEREVRNVQRSQVGGWRSDDDLFEWPFPEVTSLRERVMDMMQGMLSIYTGGQSVSGDATMKAWATVARSGDFTRVHTHPATHLSGVYFASGGEPDGTRPEAGQYGFIDPRIGIEMTPAPGLPYGERLAVTPAAGTMVMYPSWLQHYTEPFFGAGERIAVSFTAFVTNWEASPRGAGAGPGAGETLQ